MHNESDINAGTGETPLSCLLAALTRLMTHYAMRPNSENAQAVVRLLEALNSHPEAAEQPLLQNTYGRMLPHWQCLVLSRKQPVLNSGETRGSLH